MTIDGARSRRLLSVTALVACLLAAGPRFSTTADSQQSVFRSGVDLVAVDVQVVDRDGHPIGNLAANNFHVWINGQERKVVSADHVEYPLASARSITQLGPDAPNVILRSDVPQITGRVIVIAIDEMSFTAQALPAVNQTIRKFIASLPPDDVVATYPYPFGTGRVDLTHFHTAAGVQLGKIQGLRPTMPTSEFSLTTSEAIDIFANDSSVESAVYERECLVPSKGQCFDKDSGTVASGGAQGSCSRRIKAIADEFVGTMESVSAISFAGLRDLLQSLPVLSGPKTVVLISAGLTASDRAGGRPDVQGMMTQAGKLAAAADASLYVLHFDTHFTDAGAASAAAMQVNPCQSRMSNGITHESRDADLESYGLQRVAAEAGGDYIRIQAGTGEIALNRVLTETSAYYLLGVQPEPVDRDGRAHFIRVQTVGVKGASLRARKEVTIPRGTNGG